MLAGWNGATGTPSAASTGAQAPSDPSRAQLAPPKASTVTAGVTRRGPSGVSNSTAAPSNPVQRQRVTSRTPCAPSRASQARSRGDAFIATGKTRPDDPVNTGWPSPRHQSCTCMRGQTRASIGSSHPGGS
jgi:hypothetical protein